jgi:hypothetical protein
MVAALVALPSLLLAQPAAHYVPGVEGIKGPSLPPPGIYLRDYNVVYDAGRLNNANGHEIAQADPDAFIYANVVRLIWITNQTFLGGRVGADAVQPFQYTSLKINTPGGGRYNDKTWGVGDFFAEGTLSWHPQQFDFAVGYGLWMPTGHSAAGLTTRAGLGFWTHMMTAGVTWYPDLEKAWAVSLLNRYEINQRDRDTDITTGQVYSLDWAVSREVAKTVEAGVVGYYQAQVTDDRGTGAESGLNRVAGVGPEVGISFPKLMLSCSLRYVEEFHADSRLQGRTFGLILTKRF